MAWGKTRALSIVVMALLATPPAFAQQAPKPTVLVHIESRKSVTLETQSGTFVCQGACDREIPLDATYRIVGLGIRHSKLLQLGSDSRGRATLVVTPASRAAFAAGISVLVVGASAAGVGLEVAIIGALSNMCLAFCGNAPSDSTAVDVGLVMLGVGLVASLIGGMLIAANSSTDVESVDGTPRSEGRAPAPSHDNVHPSGGLPMMTMPLFRATF